MADNQAIAADPALSAFVSANAGSGKTSTLVNRVARLLLAGADPSTVLCVTYTKAAAAEMQRRLFDRLGAWSVQDDEDLRKALSGLQGPKPASFDHADLSRARALFARALETPGGLKIQTIHAFCEKLLRRFPVEAGVSPSFEVVDDAAAADLAAEARAALARRAFEGGEDAETRVLSDAYDRFSVSLAFDAFEDMFRTFETRRSDLSKWIGEMGGLAALPAKVAAIVGVEALEDADMVEAQAVTPPALELEAYRVAAAALEAGGANDLKVAASLRSAIAAVEAGDTPLDPVRAAFFTGEGRPRASMAGKKISPSVTAWLVDEQVRLEAAFERARAQRIASDTVYALTLAGIYVREYEAAKQRRRVLDFADLVEKTAALLEEREDAQWVLYKLDEGIAHVLIDEAQDTAPEQWDMLRRITGDFFAGEGAGAQAGERDLGRSVFIVGDEKQSIFSFQGAQPERLREEAAAYASLARAMGARWEALPLPESWRSTQEILTFVDAVFAPGPVRAGLLPRTAAAEDVLVEHVARRIGDAGCVDLWDLEREEPQADRDAWTDPVDQRGPGAWKRLADKVALEIRDLVARGDLVFDKDQRRWRPARPGDVIVLVKKRGAMFEETIRALKRHRVPVAGADRLLLSEHPVFEDAVALIRFVQFPDDDLTLAGLLRSPFCDIDEESLYRLARGREGSLWHELRARREQQQDWVSAYAFLAQARAHAAGRTPFDFLSRLYSSLDENGRSHRTRVMTRLGPEAGEALEELLTQVLAAERRGVRDLEAVAHALGRLDVVVKREMDEPKGQVRVMTAHGAKGLEAPIVILPETVAVQDPRGSPLLDLEDGGFLWSGGKKYDCGASRAARELRKRKTEDEALRLLYVALTRARDRVILAGRARAKPKGQETLKGWYPLVDAAFEHEAIKPRVRRVTEAGLTFRRFGPDPERQKGAGQSAFELGLPLPPWARRSPAPEPRALRWTSPSEMADRSARSPAPSPLAATGGLGRFRRGELIHKLFEMLPDVARSERQGVCDAFLEGQPDLNRGQRAEIAAAVFDVLADPRFAEVFGPGSRAEVAVAGRAPGLPPGMAISGRLDRLVVTRERVLVVDYKTNRPAPEAVEDADPAYVTQLAAYAAVLGSVYPDRPVEAALLWTDGPRLMPLPQPVLDMALAALAGS
ncbi:MAG: double-strand break repair helicase AddA [Caulobacteraceae bacterium]|nr:double-strand break repair helicase AddA [Caulobacteraceae bacterium]